MKMLEHTYTNSMGTFQETYWDHDFISSSFPSPIREKFCAQVITDCIESRYRLAYSKAGYLKPPFQRLSAQYLLDAASVSTTNGIHKRDLMRVTYPLTWDWDMNAGGGLVDIYSYTHPENMRGEFKWVMPCQGTKYPICDHQGYGYIFGDKRKIERVVKSLENEGPLYGEFFIYDGYGMIDDYRNHASGEPHHGYKPAKEDIANWRLYPREEVQRQAMLLLGTGTYTPHDGSSPQNYFVYKNNWGPQWGINGYLRISEDFLAEVWIPKVPSIPATTDPNADPPRPLDTRCFATAEETSSS